MFTSFHAKLSWADVKTHKFDMRAKQPISCAEGEVSTKNWNFEHESTSWDFHVGSWRNMFWSKMRCFSWYMDENVWMQSRVGELVSWEFDEWKSFEVEKRMIWVEKKSENERKVWVFTLRKIFSLEKLGWNGKNLKIQS